MDSTNLLPITPQGLPEGMVSNRHEELVKAIRGRCPSWGRFGISDIRSYKLPFFGSTYLAHLEIFNFDEKEERGRGFVLVTLPSKANGMESAVVSLIKGFPDVILNHYSLDASSGDYIKELGDDGLRGYVKLFHLAQETGRGVYWIVENKHDIPWVNNVAGQLPEPYDGTLLPDVIGVNKSNDVFGKEIPVNERIPAVLVWADKILPTYWHVDLQSGMVNSVGEDESTELQGVKDVSIMPPEGFDLFKVVVPDLGIGLDDAGFELMEMGNGFCEGILNQLAAQYQFESNRSVVFRLYSIPFYNKYRLLRIIEQPYSEDQYGGRQLIPGRSSYAFINENSIGGEGDFDLIPLDGSAQPIREVNTKEGGLKIDTGNENDVENTFRCYLMFFTWAIHADEGNFAIVTNPMGILDKGETIHDLTKKVSEKENDFTESNEWIGLECDVIVRNSDENPEVVKQQWKASVLYGKMLFHSQFAVTYDGDSVFVAMEDDVAARELTRAVNSNYGDDGKLFALKIPPESTRLLCGVDDDCVSQNVSGSFFVDEVISSLNEGGAVCEGKSVADQVFLEICPAKNRNIKKDSAKNYKIKNCVFKDLVLVSSERPDLLLSFIDCSFEKGVDLSGGIFEGSLEFVDCAIDEMPTRAEVPNRTILAATEEGQLKIEDRSQLNKGFLRPAMNLQSSRVSGYLRLTRCAIVGQIFAPGLRVGGNLTLQGCRVGTTMGEAKAKVGFSKIEEWSDREFKDKRYFNRHWAAVPAIDLTLSNIGGDLELTASGADNLPYLKNAVQNQKYWLNGPKDEVRHAQVIGMIVTAVRGSIHLRDTTVGGRFYIFGLCCSDELNLHGLNATWLDTKPDNHIQHYNIQTVTQKPLWPFCSIGYVNGPVKISRHTSFESVLVRGHCGFNDSHFGGTLNFLSTKIVGDLLLFFSEANWIMAAKTAYVTGDPSRRPLEVGGQLNMLGAKLGQVQLPGVLVKGDLKAGKGSVGALDFGAGWRYSTNFADKASSGSRALAGLKKIDIQPSSMGSILIHSLNVSEDLNLSCVQVTGVENSASELDPMGIKIQMSKIGGDVIFAPSKSLSHIVKRYELNAQWDELSSVYSFDDCKSQPENMRDRESGSKCTAACSRGGEIVRLLQAIAKAKEGNYYSKFLAKESNAKLVFEFSLLINKYPDVLTHYTEFVVLLSHLNEYGLTLVQKFNDEGGYRDLGKVINDYPKFLTDCIAFSNCYPAVGQKDSEISALLNPNRPTILDYPATIEAGDLDLSANQIGGKVQLSGVKVEQGQIKLHDSTIGLDVSMSSQSELGDDGTVDFLSYSRVSTVCDNLNLEKISVGGDVDITGLKILKRGNKEAGDTGGILARDAVVRGDLLLIPEQDDRDMLEDYFSGYVARVRQAKRSNSNESFRWYASIEGKIDLTSLQVSRLIISGDNVARSEDPVVLARSTIGRFEIISPTPGPLDMTKAEVSRWSVDEEDDPSAEKFTDVFKKLDPFDTATWVAVEMRFRNETKKDEADKLYRNMRDIVLRRNESELGRKFLLTDSNRGNDTKDRVTLAEVRSYVKDLCLKPLGWGTKMYRPFWYLWVPWFALSWLLLSNPKNVDSSATYYQVAGSTVLQGEAENKGEAEELNESEDLHDCVDGLPVVHPSKWGVSDGFILTMRYAVPMAPFESHAYWEAGKKDAHIPCIGNLHLPIYQVAAIMSGLGWFSLSIALAGIARSVFRGQNN